MRRFQVILTEEEYSIVQNLVKEQITSVKAAISTNSQHFYDLLPEDVLIDEYDMLASLSKSLENPLPRE